jgi:hypothetical protein
MAGLGGLLAGLMGPGQFQSNNQAVTGPQGVNWGDPNNPADFFRASGAMGQPQGQAMNPAVPPVMPASPPLPPPRPAGLGQPQQTPEQMIQSQVGVAPAAPPVNITPQDVGYPAPVASYPSPVSISPHDVGQEPALQMAGYRNPTNPLLAASRPPIPGPAYAGAPQFPGVGPARSPFAPPTGMSALVDALQYRRQPPRRA